MYIISINEYNDFFSIFPFFLFFFFFKLVTRTRGHEYVKVLHRLLLISLNFFFLFFCHSRIIDTCLKLTSNCLNTRALLYTYYSRIYRTSLSYNS